MNFCPKCGAPLNAQAHFCPKCGNAIPDNDAYHEIYLEPVKKGNKWLLKLLYSLIIVAVVIFFYKTITGPESGSETVVSSVSTEEFSGDWYDPTGILLGDSKAQISMWSAGGKLVGNDDENKIQIELTPIAKNKFEGNVNLNGVLGRFDVQFNPENKKLVFTSKTSKLDWSIQKME
jgi:hypothetical protein